MSQSTGTHQVTQHRSAVRGVEVMTLLTDRAFPRHTHDQFGIGLMNRGGHRSWSGIGPVEAEAGDFITVNPGEMHDGLPISGQPRGWRVLYFDCAVVAREVGEELRGEMEIARPVMHDPVLAALFRRLFARLTNPVPDEFGVEEDLLRFLVHALRHHGRRRQAPLPASPAIARARRRLDEAPTQPATLAELAALAGVSRFQMLRGFARETGSTPHAYIVQQRVRLARRYLASGSPVAEAALRSGFADQSHMTRAFVRQLGVTPARYQAAVIEPNMRNLG